MSLFQFEYDENLDPKQVLEQLIRKLNHTFKFVDSKNVKRLDTNETVIRSKDGETRIQGPLILMYDKQEPAVLRRKEGYDADSGLFVDAWYDANGNIAAYIDSEGKLVVELGIFKGNIITLQDAYIGNNLVVGDMAAKSKGIYLFNDGAGNFCLVELDADGKLHIYNFGGGIEIITESSLDLSGSNVNISAENDADNGVLTTTGKYMAINNDNVVFDGDKWGIFSKSDVQQTAGLMGAKLTTQTAGAAYTVNEQQMLANLKADVQLLYAKIDGVLTKLAKYGLFEITP